MTDSREAEWKAGDTAEPVEGGKGWIQTTNGMKHVG